MKGCLASYFNKRKDLYLLNGFLNAQFDLNATKKNYLALSFSLSLFLSKIQIFYAYTCLTNGYRTQGQTM